MAKIYGTPIMAGGSGGANKDLPPLLDNFKAFKGGGTSENPHITIQAGKMATSRANELAGAVWVYGEHIPKNVNDGTKIQLTREEITRPDGEPYITLDDILASDAEIETIINIKESDGELHPYLYLSNDYLGSGAGLLLRKDCYQKGVWHNTGRIGVFNGSQFDVWCSNTFPTLLDTSISNILMEVDLPTKTTGAIRRKCFTLSNTEYGGDMYPAEGTALPYFKDNVRRQSMFNGGTVDYWTRSKYDVTQAYFIGLTGGLGQDMHTLSLGYRPAFCLPLTFKLKATPNENGSYDMYGETSVLSTFASSEFIVEKSVSWEQTKDFYARQFTYNSKKQYQTMLEGAVASIIVEGAPANVTDFQISGSGATPVLSWVNPIDDELYQETVVIQKQDSEPTDITDGTEIYRGTDETCTATGLEQSTDYYFAIYTVSGLGVYKQPVVKSYRFDFPAEPESYSMIEDRTTSGEFIAPEDGWYQLDAVSKSGDGANGDSNYGVSTQSVGSGGSGAIGRKSKIRLNKGEKISFKITTGINIELYSMYVYPGGNANGIFPGDPGSSQGADVNIPGKKGNGGGSSGLSPNRPRTPGVSTDNDFGIVTTSGYGGGVNNWAPELGGKGTPAFIRFYRGNTNIPSPSQASTLSLIPKSNSVEATWENSGDPVQTGTMLVYNTNHVPTSVNDGVSVDIPATQATAATFAVDGEEQQQTDNKKQSYTITGLTNDKPVYVALFPYDANKKYGIPKTDVEIPRVHSWYDTQQELQAEVETVKAEMADYQEYYITTQEVLK